MNDTGGRASGPDFPCASLVEALPYLRRPPTAEPRSIELLSRTAVSLTAMAGLQESGRDARQREPLERNERLRRERLRAAARRPAGELLEEAMRLSAFATELQSAPRHPRR